LAFSYGFQRDAYLAPGYQTPFGCVEELDADRVSVHTVTDDDSPGLFDSIRRWLVPQNKDEHIRLGIISNSHPVFASQYFPTLLVQ